MSSDDFLSGWPDAGAGGKVLAFIVIPHSCTISPSGLLFVGSSGPARDCEPGNLACAGGDQFGFPTLPAGGVLRGGESRPQ